MLCCECEDLSWTNQSCVRTEPNPVKAMRQWRLVCGFTSLFKPLMKKKQQRRSEERVCKTEACAEAAELLSGLVAAVIILMLVVKPLWAGKKSLSG